MCKVTHKLNYLAVVLGLIFCTGFKHPFYLGVIDLKYNNTRSCFEGSVKLFTSDLEDALSKLEGKKIDLIHPADTARVNQLLKTYLMKRLTFQCNNQALPYTYLGYEREQEAIWLYLETKTTQAPKTLILTNSLLYDYLKDQMNIAHVEMFGQSKSSKAVNPIKTHVFDF